MVNFCVGLLLKLNMMIKVKIIKVMFINKWVLFVKLVIFEIYEIFLI